MNNVDDAHKHPAAQGLVDPQHLRCLLAPEIDELIIEALPVCESTSTVLLQRARAGVPAPYLLVADRQTAGRGRRGRTWLSSPEESLTFSLLWRFQRSLADMTGLSLAVGVALARAFEACGARDIRLKWPNDVLFGDGKVAGVLIELESAPPDVLAVIGIGVNLQLPPYASGQLLYPPAALAASLALLPNRHELLASLLRELSAVLHGFAENGFTAVHRDWQARHAWSGKCVRVSEAGLPERAGVCLGADSDGALLLQTASGRQRFFSGDVSLQLP